MPARNMAGLTVVPTNPSAGKAVLMSPFSGPKGSPFDKDQSGNFSTGALNTGIGFGMNNVIGPTAPASIKAAGFNDNYTPGVTLPNGNASTAAILTCIGGGKSSAPVAGVSTNTPYVAQPLLGFGNGGSRDAGEGPAFTGFGTKTVTATSAVATGAVVETGFTNRSGVALTTGQSVFGQYVAASPAVT